MTLAPTILKAPVTIGVGFTRPIIDPVNSPSTSIPITAPTPTFDEHQMVQPVNHPNAPTVILNGEGSGDCEDAWVYCPGRSTCFNDSGFNGGVVAEGKWGWSIVFDPVEDTLVADCEILIGATDCDLNTGTKVGSFQMRSNFGHYCMADYGFAATSFAFYAGHCEGNDSGSFATGGSCVSNEVASNAATPETFPLNIFNENNEINFTMDSTDAINIATSKWPASHQLFPLTKKSYVSAYACVKPDPDNKFTGQGGTGILWNP
jgi:hypothetical protein